MFCCRKVGICILVVYYVDYIIYCIYMEEIGNCVIVRDYINEFLDGFFDVFE